MKNPDERFNLHMTEAMAHIKKIQDKIKKMEKNRVKGTWSSVADIERTKEDLAELLESLNWVR